jgi:hypothetical protein
VKKTARGFRNAENFKTAIYFRCGDWISTHTKAGRASLIDGSEVWRADAPWLRRKK